MVPANRNKIMLRNINTVTKNFMNEEGSCINFMNLMFSSLENNVAFTTIVTDNATTHKMNTLQKVVHDRS